MQYPNLSALRELLTELRDEEVGCAWTRDQDPKSLIAKTLEEVYELEEAILKNDWQSMKEELGDVLYHVAFYCEIARENKQFDFDDLAEIMLKKNQQRMPSKEARKQMTAEQTNDHWQKSKAQRKKREHPLAGISPYSPSHLRAFQIQERAAEYGFDWQHPSQVIAKIREELIEIEDEIENDNKAALLDECGDLLFAVINLTRKCGGHPETSLSGCITRFTERFNKMDTQIQAEQKDWRDYSLEQLEALWQQAKIAEKT